MDSRENETPREGAGRPTRPARSGDARALDSLDEAILLFDVEGNPLERWSLPDFVDFETEPEDIVIDGAGEHIYIAEVRQHRVLHLVRSP